MSERASRERRANRFWVSRRQYISDISQSSNFRTAKQQGAGGARSKQPAKKHHDRSIGLACSGQPAANRPRSLYFFRSLREIPKTNQNCCRRICSLKPEPILLQCKQKQHALTKSTVTCKYKCWDWVYLLFLSSYSPSRVRSGFPQLSGWRIEREILDTLQCCSTCKALL